MEPHRSRSHRIHQECRYCMDSEGPDNGDIDEGHIKLFIKGLAGIPFIHVIKSADKVESQIAVKDYNVPGKYGVGPAENTYYRRQMPEPVRPSHMVNDEQHNQDNCGNGKHLPYQNHI